MIHVGFDKELGSFVSNSGGAGSFSSVEHGFDLGGRGVTALVALTLGVDPMRR